MSAERIIIEGEAYLTIETVAECFEVRTSWIYEAYDQGLLGSGERRGDSLYIASRWLDRVAEIGRLRVLLDDDLNAIELFLDTLQQLERP